MIWLRATFMTLMVLVLLLSAYLTAVLLPLSLWFQPGALVIASTDYDKQPALVIYDRQIKRRFFMRYSVVVQRIAPTVIACEAPNGPFWYTPERQLPPANDLNLTWLAPGDLRCSKLPPGEYVAEVCWTATVASILPPKTVCIQSNPFTIREVKP